MVGLDDLFDLRIIFGPERQMAQEIMSYQEIGEAYCAITLFARLLALLPSEGERCLDALIHRLSQLPEYKVELTDEQIALIFADDD